jgi:hypothetical protein
LPGFNAASVWITSSITRPARRDATGTALPSALITPAVTEPARPTPDRHHELPDDQSVGVTEDDGARRSASRAQHREVRQGIDSDDIDPRFHPVGEHHLAAGARADDVRVGQ